MRISVLLILPLLLLSTSISAWAQRGAITRPSTLEQLTEESQLIVHGFVVASKVEPHPKFPNLSTVLVELKIVDVLKGDAAERLVFRQFIWDPRDRQDTAGYHKGQELVLLLNASSDIGLRSPVGLEQGRFVVRRTADGHTQAVNGTSNNFLFTESNLFVAAPSARKSAVTVPARLRSMPRALTLDDLKQLVRAYAGGR
jgi:hypothetical protein